MDLIDDLTGDDVADIIEHLDIDESTVLLEGYKALARRDYSRALARKHDGRGIFKNLRYLTPEMKESIMAQRKPIDPNKVTASVDTGKLNSEELWAWNRLTGEQRRYWGSHVEFKAWVGRGCPNSAYPESIRTPKESFR